jgi:hypothetical protein
MSLLAEVNTLLAGALPARLWFAIGFLVGVGVCVGSIIQRVCSDRYSLAFARCSGDAIMTKLSQFGLAIIATFAFVLVVDSMVSTEPSPLLALALAGSLAIQSRMIVRALVGLWRGQRAATFDPPAA